MDRQRIFATCHKPSNTWYKWGGGHKCYRRYIREYSNTLLFSYMWGLECKGGKSASETRRNCHHKTELGCNREHEGKMGNRHVWIKWLVHSQRHPTWPTSTIHIRERHKEIMYRSHTGHRSYITCGIRRKHVVGPVWPRFGENQNLTAEFHGQGQPTSHR